MTRNGYQHMVHDYYVNRVRSLSLARDEDLAGIETRDEALDYQDKVRKAVRKAFGPRPRRSPLNPRVTGKIDRQGYVIEKVLFESRPGCLVTANLYVPKGLRKPTPGVVSPCGHAQDGKALPLYQEYCQRLANSGFVVLIYDPFNQGERNQYHGVEDGGLGNSCTLAHNMMGKQIELLGEFFGMWRAWDGIRALDYLLTRPEVDHENLGITGNSGGGTLSEWIWALEDRFTMAAPSCFVTTFLTNLENEIPQDCEQYPPGILGAGLEMADLMILRAPKPALLLGQTYDYFDKRGLRRAHVDLKRFYRILGHPENVDLFIGPHGHGYFKENQDAMVRFFVTHAGLRGAKSLRQPETLDTRKLFVTAEGSTVAAGARPVFELIGEKAHRLAQGREAPDLKALKRRLRLLLALPRRTRTPRYRILRPETFAGVRLARYAVETEAGIRVVLRKPVSHPEEAYSLDAEGVVSLYVPHTSSQEDVAQYVGEKALARPPSYAVDPRGMGESMPEGGPEGFFHPYGMDYMFHGFGILLGESYLGRRIHDVLSTMDLLVSRGTRRIDLYGRGQGAIIALFSALLHPMAGEVTLKNGPTSLEHWAKAPIVSWPAANFPRGILRYFDLPDCIRVLGEKVKVVDPWGPGMKPLHSDSEPAIKDHEEEGRGT